MVSEVKPVVQAGAYAALAYAGTLAGYSTAAQAVASPLFGGYLRHLLHYELAPQAGSEALLQQLAQPTAVLSLQPLTENGSQQWLPLLLTTAEQRLQAGEAVDAVCFTVAAWLRFTMGFDGKGDTLQVVDPLAEQLMQIRLQHWDHIDELVDQYLQVQPLFSAALRDSVLFRDRLTYWLSYILANGMVTALQTLVLEVQDYSAAPRLAGGSV